MLGGWCQRIGPASGYAHDGRGSTMGARSGPRYHDAPDRHRLAVVKANYGPSMVSADLTTCRTRGGALVGLDGAGAAWQHGTPSSAPRNGRTPADVDVSEV